MTALIRQTNSWHWLLMSMAASLIAIAYPCHLVRTIFSIQNGPKLQAMAAHAEQLKLLHEDDVILLEQQTAEILSRVNTYETAVREKAGQPIPVGEPSALTLRNEINRALLTHHLRIVSQAQEEVRETKEPGLGVPSTRFPPELADPGAESAQAAPVAVMQPAKQKPRLPFTTREVHYVVEGEYRHMFMFLVRQSHLKPSYHFKDIKIIPAPHQPAMRMEFTVQIHFI